MLFSRRCIQLLSVLAVLFAITQANLLDVNVLDKRQGDNPLSGVLAGGGGQSDSSSASQSTNTGSTTHTGTSTTQPSGSSSSSSTPSTSPSSSSSSTSNTSSSQSSTSTTASTSQSSSTTSTNSDASTSPSVHITTQVVVKTTDGSIYSSTIISSSTSGSTGTSAASLNGSGSSSSSGMSTGTKNTIIGVCVGVGGAALLGGIAFVLLKLRRNRNNREETDGLMGFRSGVDSSHEKTSSASGAPNPFQTTLEGYHAPPRNANVSSNF